MWVKDKPRQDITVAARHFRKLRYTGGLLLTRRVASGGKRKKKRKKRPMSRDREDATGTRLTNPWERESSKSICSLRADRPDPGFLEAEWKRTTDTPTIRVVLPSIVFVSEFIEEYLLFITYRRINVMLHLVLVLRNLIFEHSFASRDERRIKSGISREKGQ